MSAESRGASGARSTRRLAVLLLALVAVGAPAAGDGPDPAGADAPPRSVDLGPGLEAAGLGPRRQGARGTCSVFTMTGEIEAAIARAEGHAVRLSVDYLNWAANHATGRSTDGQFFHTAWAGYACFGVAPEKTMPYARRFDPKREPSDSARRSAKALSRYRLEIRWIKPLDGTRGVTAAHLAAVKTVLARGVPVCAGSYHSVLFVGYEDDPARPGGGVFRCFNSGSGRRDLMSYQEARGRLGDICWIDGPSAPEAHTAVRGDARAGGSPAVTLASLLREVADLDHLTRLPVPSYRAAQASSYDRASKNPRDEKGWFANGDRGHFVRVEQHGGRRERVLLDVKGPGALTRIWSANPAGTLRIYLDGAETPAIAAPMARLLGGKVAPFLPPFAYVAAKGCNLYFPIPYAARCKVTSDAGGFGHTSLNRFLVLDPIPFSRSLRFDLEVWHWHRKIDLPYAVTSYWYGRPGATDDSPPLTADALRVPVVPARRVKRVPGALEGERLDARASAGVASRQDMAGFGDGWSGDAQLFWRGPRPDARLSLRFRAPAAGRYRVRLGLTRAPDYGSHRISLPGGPPVEVDLWSPRVVPGPVLDLGVRTLSAGTNAIVVEVTGTNARAQPKAFLFGLDYLLLRRVGDF